MPLFGKKKKDNSASPSHEIGSRKPAPKTHETHVSDVGASNVSSRPSNGVQDEPEKKKAKYNFYCQLAHGSPTGIISGFTNIKELYAKIAECYEMDPLEILFCTLNSHKVDMEKLLGGQIAMEDFIFAHVKGQRKEIDIHKSEDALGLTITDNGAGYAFIKRIKPDSIVDHIKQIEVGDHIEKIDGESFVGRRHYDVARRLKEITKGTTFTLRLVTPEKTPFANFGPRSGAGGKSAAGISSGKKTLRLKGTGEAVEADAPNIMEEAAMKKIGQLIENLLGIDDREMAQSIWELGKTKTNPHEFSIALDQEMGQFGFPDELILDIWGVIGDAKANRLKPLTSAPSSTTPTVYEECF